ncbi:hypothetical protein EKM05_06055 [Flavobacterium sp. GSP27]|uniref:Beta-carotene 15,15'-monooxygenase n=1 Tax=Flavobacterium bomense TaxID=2497483 RepID=A0A432CP02_9FLAO|nr:hypothetical protein EKL96_11735 [Flavobacterium sp. LS1R10]RTY94850.1 hypothetical protein EKL32_10040 [Flavobacterium sp. GSN2]RTZ06093.1 hypothetical protein EKL98_06010 [Flavobacterium bomense]RTZ09990.1 hypothetical protein EKM05_06055 [Flavobacterium sp. GSP27]
MKTTQNRIHEIEKNGYPLDFGIVFNHAFENYKKIAIYAGLIIFVFFILLIVFVSVILVAFFDSAMILEKMKPENLQPENLSLNFILIVSGVSVLLSSLFSPISAGLIKMAYCAERDEEFHVSTMFEYYKISYFKELFIATLLISIFSTLLSSLIDYAQIPFIGFIITVTITLFTILTIPLIIFGNLNAIEALKSSILIVVKQPLILLGLLVVGAISTLVGLIGCCIGIVFTVPFMYSLYYAIYSEIIGFETTLEPEQMF